MRFGAAASHAPPGHPETMKRLVGWVQTRRMGAAKRNPSSLFGTAFHVPPGHPETMKKPVGWANRSEAHRNFLETESQLDNNGIDW